MKTKFFITLFCLLLGANMYAQQDSVHVLAAKLPTPELPTIESIDDSILIRAGGIKPEFLGGENELLKFLAKNLLYPAKAIEKGIQGRVQVQVIITKTGEITDVKILKSVHTLLDKEAIRVIKLMPNWIAGTLNGEPVNVSIIIPFVFRLNR